MFAHIGFTLNICLHGTNTVYLWIVQARLDQGCLQARAAEPRDAYCRHPGLEEAGGDSLVAVSCLRQCYRTMHQHESAGNAEF